MRSLTGSSQRARPRANGSTTTAARRNPPRVGHLLRQWRQQRRMSQLDLALSADVSSRHLSFIETGRSAASREMLLSLARQLDLPLREQNRLLQAAGYAPAYSELPLDGPGMAPVRAAVRQLLSGHEPYPATLLDWRWNVVDRNTATDLFLDEVAPQLLAPPVNVMRLCLHPAGLAPRIVDLAAFRARLLHRLRRQLDVMPDAARDAAPRVEGLPGQRGGSDPVPRLGPPAATTWSGRYAFATATARSRSSQRWRRSARRSTSPSPSSSSSRSSQPMSPPPPSCAPARGAGRRGRSLQW